MKKIKENTIQPILVTEETPEEYIKEEVNTESQGSEDKKEATTNSITETTENSNEDMFPF